MEKMANKKSKLLVDEVVEINHTLAVDVPALSKPMSCLSRDFWGLGNPRTIRILSHLTNEKCSKVLFLVEKNCTKARMKEVRRILKFEGCFVVDNILCSGRLALLWKSNWSVKIYSYTRWHINAFVQEEEGGPTWLFTGFYGHPIIAKREASWELLKSLKPQPYMSWLCTWDLMRS